MDCIHLRRFSKVILSPYIRFIKECLRAWRTFCSDFFFGLFMKFKYKVFVYHCISVNIGLRTYNFNSEKLWILYKMSIQTKQRFADLIKLCFIHNRTKKTYQAMKVRYFIISWSILTNSSLATGPGSTPAFHPKRAGIDSSRSWWSWGSGSGNRTWWCWTSCPQTSDHLP